MKGLLKANFTMRWIEGILFLCFGLIFLLAAAVRFPDLGVIPGGILALCALARLVLVSLPAGRPFVLGSGALEITSGVLETLFGVLFVLNTLWFMEFFYPLVAGLFAVLAVVRIRQGALVRKQGVAGMGAYLFAGILLLVAAAGLAVDMVWLRAGLLTELVGAAALLYGAFLFTSSFFRRVKPDTGNPEEAGGETRAGKNPA